MEAEAGKAHPKVKYLNYYKSDSNKVIKGQSNGKKVLSDLKELDIEYKKTDIIVEGPRDVSVERDIFGNIYVLDENNSKLYRYDISDSTHSVVADNTPGPKGIPAAVDFDIKGKDIFVATRKMRIVRFTCGKDKCSHTNSNTLNFMPRSIAVGQNGAHAIGFAYTENIEREKFGRLIHKLNEGEITKSYGNMYRSKNPIVVYKMNRGPIESVGGGRLTFSLRSTPYIRIFEDGDLKKVFEVNNFNVPIYKEGNNPISLTINQAMKASIILHINDIGSGKFTFSIYHRKWNKEFSKKRPREVSEEKVSYYFVDLSSDNYSYLGKVEGDIESNPYIFFTSGKPVVLKKGNILLPELTSAPRFSN